MNNIKIRIVQKNNKLLIQHKKFLLWTNVGYVSSLYNSNAEQKAIQEAHDYINRLIIKNSTIFRIYMKYNKSTNKWEKQ